MWVGALSRSSLRTTTSDKLSENERHEAETMLSLKTSKIIQDKLVKETSKAVILKDLSNTSTRRKSGNTQNDLQESIKRPTDKYGELLGDTGTHILNITDSRYELQAGVTMLTKTLSYGYETTSEASWLMYTCPRKHFVPSKQFLCCFLLHGSIQ